MKKFLAILLISVMVMSLTVNFSFADEVSETEKEEILRVAKEGLILYDIFGGWGSVYRDDFDRTVFGYDEYEDFISEIVDIQKNIVKDEYEYINDSGSIEYVMLRWFYKAGEKIQSINDINNLINEYFIGHKVNITDESTVKYNEQGVATDYPTLIIENGETYIESFSYRLFAIEVPILVLKKFEVLEINKDEAIVQVVGECPYCGGGEIHDHTEVFLELNMVKTENGWRINGGNFFEDDCIPFVNWYPEKSPETGENTVLYIAIAGAAVVCMTALLVRKKREIV